MTKTNCLLTTLLKDQVQKRGHDFAESTVLLWMHKLGFRYGKANKGVFKDGHESPEVVEFGKFSQIRQHIQLNVSSVIY